MWILVWGRAALWLTRHKSDLELNPSKNKKNKKEEKIKFDFLTLFIWKKALYRFTKGPLKLTA